MLSTCGLLAHIILPWQPDTQNDLKRRNTMSALYGIFDEKTIERLCEESLKSSCERCMQKEIFCSEDERQAYKRGFEKGFREGFRKGFAKGVAQAQQEFAKTA